MQLNHFLSQMAGEAWASSRLLKDLAKLIIDIGPRFAGTASEKTAAAFIENRLRETGATNVWNQSFSFRGYSKAEGRLQVERQLLQRVHYA